MRKFLSLKLILVLPLLTAPAWATWTQRARNVGASCSGASTTCNLTVTNPTAGDLLWGVVMGPNAVITLTSITCGTDTLTNDAGSSISAESVFIGTAYKLSATGGTGTTCTATLSTNPGGAWKFIIEQWTPSSSPAVFDTSNTRDQNTNTTSPVAPTITLTSGANNLIFEMENAVTGSAITGGCSGGTGYTQPDAWSSRNEAYCYNSNDSTAPTWTTANAKCALAVIAFKESGAAVKANVIVVE